MQNKKSNWKTSKKNIKYLLPESRAEGRKKNADGNVGIQPTFPVYMCYQHIYTTANAATTLKIAYHVLHKKARYFSVFYIIRHCKKMSYAKTQLTNQYHCTYDGCAKNEVRCFAQTKMGKDVCNANILEREIIKTPTEILAGANISCVYVFSATYTQPQTRRRR